MNHDNIENVFSKNKRLKETPRYNIRADASVLATPPEEKGLWFVFSHRIGHAALFWSEDRQEAIDWSRGGIKGEVKFWPKGQEGPD